MTTNDSPRYTIVDAPFVLGYKIIEAVGLDKTLEPFDDENPGAEVLELRFRMRSEAMDAIRTFLKKAEGGFKQKEGESRKSNVASDNEEILTMAMQEYIKLGVLVYVVLAGFAEQTSWKSAEDALVTFLRGVEDRTTRLRDQSHPGLV